MAISASCTGSTRRRRSNAALARSRSRRSRACSRTTRLGMGLLHGALTLAAIWWAWTTYVWLTSAIDVDGRSARSRSSQRTQIETTGCARIARSVQALVVDENAGSFSCCYGGTWVAVEDTCGQPAVEEQREAVREPVRVTRVRSDREPAHPGAYRGLVLDGAGVYVAARWRLGCGVDERRSRGSRRFGTPSRARRP